MQIFDLDGKPVKALSELTRAARAHRKNVREKCQVIHLKPGAYNLVTKGHGAPGAGFPKRCLVCRKEIGEGRAWIARDNGQYVTIQHVTCGRS